MNSIRNRIIFIVILFILMAGIGYYFVYQIVPGKKAFTERSIDSTLIVAEVLKMYEIPVDSFNIQSDKVKRNQMLLSILANYNLPEGALNKLLLLNNPVFDLRKIRSGNKYTVFLEKDSLSTLRYLVYEHSPIEYVRFYFADTVIIELAEKVVVQQRKITTGVINSSLWNAIVETGANPILASELSEIYAWSIDFFGLQPTDSFAVVYDEQFVDSVSVGLGKIYTAYFRHVGSNFYAIPFLQDSVEGFFDIEGNSLRKAFLKAPLRFSRISSRFSNSRLHPVLKIRRPHHGVDYSAPVGTPVQSIGDGKIIEANHGYNRGGGNFIKIRHNSTYTTAYLHLSGFAKGIGVGKYVQQGEIIGYVGSTGLSTGPHLDFRFYKNGSAIDPLKVESPPVEPIHPQNKMAFDSVKASCLKLLLVD